MDVIKLIVTPLVYISDSFKLNNYFRYIAFFIHACIMLYAGYLCWKLNSQSLFINKILITISAIIFSYLYLIFHLVVYFMKSSDNNSSPNDLLKPFANNYPAFTPEINQPPINPQPQINPPFKSNDLNLPTNPQATEIPPFNPPSFESLNLKPQPNIN
jgi:hypothetical protein